MNSTTKLTIISNEGSLIQKPENKIEIRNKVCTEFFIVVKPKN